MAVGRAEGHKTRVRKKIGIGEFDEAKTRKRVFISSLSWLSPQLARRRDVPADMTPGEDERVEPVDLVVPIGGCWGSEKREDLVANFQDMVEIGMRTQS